MKKILSIATLALAAVFLLVACGKSSSKTSPSSSSEKAENKIIKVAVHTAPMTDMLEAVKEDLKKDGYDLELVKVTDNVQANVALNNKEVDANFFQHKLFMEAFNKGNDGNLVFVQPIYNALVAFYSKNYKSVDELPEGAKIAIPSDGANRARALRMLASKGLISLKDEDSYNITLEDITENKKNFEFQEVSLLNLNEAYNEADLVFNYPTYIAKLDLAPTKDGLILEEPVDSTFAVGVAAREDNKDSDAVKALKKALTSETIKSFIEEKLKGHAVVAF